MSRIEEFFWGFAYLIIVVAAMGLCGLGVFDSLT